MPRQHYNRSVSKSSKITAIMDFPLKYVIFQQMCDKDGMQ